MNKLFAIALATLIAGSVTGSVKADSTALNTIPTPVVRSLGQLELNDSYAKTTTSYSDQAQAAAGVAKDVEVRYTRAIHPGTASTVDAKATIFDTAKIKVAVGTLGFENFKTTPQSYAVAGLYEKTYALIGGAVRVDGHNTEAMAGLDLKVAAQASLQVDYRSGKENYSGVGLNYAVNEQVSVEPGVLHSNAINSDYYGYVTVKCVTSIF